MTKEEIIEAVKRRREEAVVKFGLIMDEDRLHQKEVW